MTAAAHDRPPLHLADTPPSDHAALADRLAEALDLPSGDVTVELVYRDQRLARIHIHTHRTITRGRTA